MSGLEKTPLNFVTDDGKINLIDSHRDTVIFFIYPKLSKR